VGVCGCGCVSVPVPPPLVPSSGSGKAGGALGRAGALGSQAPPSTPLPHWPYGGGRVFPGSGMPGMPLGALGPQLAACLHCTCHPPPIADWSTTPRMCLSGRLLSELDACACAYQGACLPLGCKNVLRGPTGVVTAPCP
jgi:hypothetical protein